MNQAIESIRRESWKYSIQKPDRVPPANSPSRPALASLWEAAQRALNHVSDLQTFKHCGHSFGIFFLGEKPCVVDLETRRILVRSPTLARELVERSVLDADEAHENYCKASA